MAKYVAELVNATEIPETSKYEILRDLVECGHVSYEDAIAAVNGKRGKEVD